MSDQPQTSTLPTGATGHSLASANCSALYPLFEHMSREHGLTLTDSELNEICRVADGIRAKTQTCQWGECHSPATYRDKNGLLLCADCIQSAAAYTCGIVSLPPNDQTQPRAEKERES